MACVTPACPAINVVVVPLKPFSLKSLSAASKIAASVFSFIFIYPVPNKSSGRSSEDLDQLFIFQCLTRVLILGFSR